jgi:arylsulfatase
VSVDLALEWIDERPDQPFFLMLHLFDVHRHYDAPEPVRGTFTDVFADRYGAEAMATLESRIAAEAAGDLEFHVAAYDEEILWVDGQLGRFFDQLDARGLRDSALVVLTSDHGEAFREHGWLAHGNNLYNEVLRVPWMAWGPGVAPGHREGPAATVDILPTVLEFAGVEVPPAGGLSLWPQLRDLAVAAPERQILAQNRMYSSDLAVVIDWPLKLLQDFIYTTTELYDLSVDPLEMNNLGVEGDGPLMRRLRSMRREARALRESSVGGSVELSEEMRQELRSLGYIQ